MVPHEQRKILRRTRSLKPGGRLLPRESWREPGEAFLNRKELLSRDSRRTSGNHEEHTHRREGHIPARGEPVNCARFQMHSLANKTSVVR